jgi:hypothetical protein
MIAARAVDAKKMNDMKVSIVKAGEQVGATKE